MPNVLPPGKPFNCSGCPNFQCLKDLKVFEFDPKNEVHWQEWGIRHMRVFNPDFKVCDCSDEDRDLYLVESGAHKDHLRCKSTTCKKVLPRHIIPFFKGSKLSLTNLMAVLWSMCEGTRQKHAMSNFDISKTSIVQWQTYFCEVAVKVNSKLFETVRQRITFAQIDETAFGKRKYNRGHRVRIGSTIWVWGLVGLGADGKTLYVHFEYVPCRNTEMIVSMLRKMIGPNVREIASDCWAATVRAMRTEFPNVTHKKVNHSREFVAHDGTHTNTIESHNNVLKSTLKERWSHMPEDAYLLDIKVAFAQLIINCSPRRLNMDPFGLMVAEIFRYGQAPQGITIHDDDYFDGETTEDGFGMGEEPETDGDTEVEQDGPETQPQGKVQRRSERLRARDPNAQGMN